MKLTAKAQKALEAFLELTVEDNAQPGWAILAQIASLNQALKAAAEKCSADDARARGVLESVGLDPLDAPHQACGEVFTSIHNQLDQALEEVGMQASEWEPRTFTPRVL